jgi:hypothetical protein
MGLVFQKMRQKQLSFGNRLPTVATWILSASLVCAGDVLVWQIRSLYGAAGISYEHGSGVERNPAKAVGLYELATSAGDVAAKRCLGEHAALSYFALLSLTSDGLVSIRQLLRTRHGCR